MIINASKFDELTHYARKNGYACEEKYDLAGVKNPVILSDRTDKNAQVANTLVSNGIPVLYLAVDVPTNISPRVYVLTGERVTWKQVEQWIKQALAQVREKEQIANLTIKRTIGLFGVSPGVGASTLARSLAFISANTRKTLYIDLNYRFPKAPYLIGYKDSRLNLENLFETILSGERANIEQYCLHKSKIDNPTKQQQKHFKTLPDNLYVLAPSGERGIEYFPNLGDDLLQVTDLMKKIVDGAKPYFESIVISMSSDPDDILNIATLRTCDTRIFVTDTNPASIFLYPSRVELLKNSGVKTGDSKLVLTKSPQSLKVQPFEEILKQNVDHTIPYDPGMVEAINNLELIGGSKYQKAVNELAFKLFGQIGQEKVKTKKHETNGILSWLRSSSKAVEGGIR